MSNFRSGVCCRFVALFLGRFGPSDLTDRCLVYFSVLHDPFGHLDFGNYFA